MPTPPTRFAQHVLPQTRKVMAADDFGAFGKITTDYYFGSLKKLKGAAVILPVMREMGVVTVADLAYLNPQHVSAAMKLRTAHVAKTMPAELAGFQVAVTEAQAGLRKLLIPFKQKMFDLQKL